MSSDEVRRKTVCLKLAKNGIYLCKNPNDAKFQPGKISLTDLPKIYGSSYEGPGNSAASGRKAAAIDKGPKEETVLQKFIRGFDCGEFCDDTSNDQINQDIPYSFIENNMADLGNSNVKVRKRQKKDTGGNRSNSRCRVEFVSPVGQSAVDGSEVRPLVVDFSRRENVKKEHCPLSKDELRLLNRNFITPKVKVENYSSLSNSSNQPLVIRAPDTPVSSYSPQSPYPSTKIEIDFTRSSLHSEDYVNSEISSQPDYSSTCDYDIINQDIHLANSFLGGTDNNYGNLGNNKSVRHVESSSIPQDGNTFSGSSALSALQNQTLPWEVIEAARQLYWKRTRTLLQWMRPESASGSQVKSSIDYAWSKLPDWQKQIYIDQVLGKCSGESACPMVNPEIVDMADDESWARRRASCSMPTLTAAPNQSTKKRKYTKKSSNQIASPSSIYNFFSSL